MSYFSEREQGERPRDSEVIGEGAWGGVQALLRSRVEDGSFGATYPETCDDGAGRRALAALRVRADDSLRRLCKPTTRC